MIAIDSSAIVAIMLAEPEAEAFVAVIGARACVMSAFNLFETETVLLRRLGAEAAGEVRPLLELAGVRVAPFDDEQASLASEACRRFGKGRHRAALNLGDCAAYALAKSLNAPLLFKGGDFALTDVTPAHTPD